MDGRLTGRTTIGRVVVGVVGLIGAACTSGDSLTDAPPSTGEVVDGIVEDEPLADEAAGDVDGAMATEIVSRSMPLDGNRLIEGEADLSLEPNVVPGGGDFDGLLGWEDTNGVVWTTFDQAEPFELLGDGSDTPPFPVPLNRAAGAFVPNAVPDTISVRSGTIVAALVDPTDRYPHGALGDDIEAAAISIVRVADDGSTDGVVVALAEADVVEGISPMLADLTDDGVPEIIVTVSNASGGARIVVYDVDGQLVAESDPIGQGNRWRHQIAVGPTGPNGETEIVVVRTPHIGGIVEWFRLEGDQLVLAGSHDAAPLTSHRLGSTNLDLAAVFDADADGALELVVPTQDRSSLAVLGRTETGGEIERIVEVPGGIVTNLATVVRDDGTIVVAVGTTDGAIVSWGE